MLFAEAAGDEDDLPRSSFEGIIYFNFGETIVGMEMKQCNQVCVSSLLLYSTSIVVMLVRLA